MPPSQLKQLKNSLHDNGVLGPQKSKKQKRQNAKSGANAQNRAQRESALEAIRERFNPFEIRTVSRSKFDVTTRDGASKSAAGSFRPGVTKSLGEEKRRQTLLQEMERKHRVGGIMDRRFGENDPTMTPEERAAERFARASQKKLQKDSMFNLEEDDDDDEFQLTHMGESLSFGGGDGVRDDFQEDVEADDMSDSEMPQKRKRFLDDGEIEDAGSQDGEEVPDRKKSKHEVMQEVIAKSKFHKAQRQMAKEDDDDLREELDKGLPDLFEMLRSVQPPAAKPEQPTDDLAGMNPDRAAILQGHSQGDLEKEYDQRLKQLTFDKRSMPTDRTKTEEEKVEEEAQRLKKLEEERIRRMRGEDVSEDESEVAEEEDKDAEESEDESLPDDAKDFGLQQPTNYATSRPDGVEDEDDFIIDDLVESGSDVDISFDEEDDDMGAPAEESEEENDEDDEEDELINGFTMPGDGSGDSAAARDAQVTNDGLAYTYQCPDSHEEFLGIVKDVSYEDLPTVIQRIRALHHPRLHSGNKAKLGRFAGILVQHVAYMAEQPQHPPFAILENVLRHVHSLAKSHPESVSLAFRAQLREIATDRPLSLRPGDLAILTGIATIFPTSDHFHAISTPAHLCLARYLGQGPINTLSDICMGTYTASLAVQYQTASKRYMPELLNYVLNALCLLSPEEPPSRLGSFPLRKPTEPLHLKPSKSLNAQKLQFWDVTGENHTTTQPEDLKLSLITTLTSLLNAASDLWSTKSAATEIFEQAQAVLQHVSRSCTNKKKNLIPASTLDTIQTTLDKLSAHLSQARLARRPLFLHNHKPLAVKTAIPKFEESFNPDKHYDPNRDRAELNRLKAEYKRERKGAMRELRKDANFVAREQLREKKEKDAAYEQKYKKLVAEVQNEEGREANAYEREKRLRQGKR